MDLKKKSKSEIVLRSVLGGFLVQQEDESICNHYEIKTQSHLLNQVSVELMQFGEIVCKYLKSNAIALVAQVEQDFVLVGGGSGQPNRIDSFCDLAWKRYQAHFPEVAVQDVILISDAFFPFSDIIDECGKRGIKKIIQPGGSIQDHIVIERANELGISMAFTGMRHFRHG
jgi:phosphoribosylaminoimidazolecarboxamide formyltransferase/IMP cyclohydrolase